MPVPTTRSIPRACWSALFLVVVTAACGGNDKSSATDTARHGSTQPVHPTPTGMRLATRSQFRAALGLHYPNMNPALIAALSAIAPVFASVLQHLEWPEAFDFQKLGVAGGVYGPMAAVVSTSSIAAVTDAALQAEGSRGMLAGLIFRAPLNSGQSLAGTVYDLLGIGDDTPYQCLYLYKDGTSTKGYLVPAVNLSTGADTSGAANCESSGPRREMVIHRFTPGGPAATPHASARFIYAPRGGARIWVFGFRCFEREVCEMGPPGPAWENYEDNSLNNRDPLPFDVQELADAPVEGLRAAGGLAAIFPERRMNTGSQTIATIKFLSAARGRYREHFGGGRVYHVSGRTDPANDAVWHYDIDREGGHKTGTGDRKVHPGEPLDLPLAVRWRWSDTDEGMWARCSGGCCSIEGDGLFAALPTRFDTATTRRLYASAR